MEKLTGILLCGGKSLRMGTDKALLELQHQPMVSYSLRILQKYCHNIIISANDSRLDFLGYHIVYDVVKNIGPMGGLHACLMKSTNRRSIVLACDMPLITGNLLKQMLDVESEYDVVAPKVNQRPEPLHAIYQKSILSKIEQAISQKTYSLHKLLSQLNVFYMDMDVQQTNELFNANTPAELKAYERLSGSSLS